MKPKTKRIVNIIAAIVPAAMAIMSGIMKFTAAPELVAGFEKIGIAKQMPLLGTMEIVFSILYIIPRTMRLGFILLSCYFAGALAVEMANNMPFNALTPIVLVWIGTFVRDRSVFFPTTPKAEVAGA